MRENASGWELRVRDAQLRLVRYEPDRSYRWTQVCSVRGSLTPGGEVVLSLKGHDAVLQVPGCMRAAARLGQLAECAGLPVPGAPALVPLPLSSRPPHLPGRCEWGPAVWCSSPAAAVRCGRECFCATAGPGLRAGPRRRAWPPPAKWETRHDCLVANHTPPAGWGPPQVVFIGDSITEMLAGTLVSCPRPAEWAGSGGDARRQVFLDTFGSLHPLVLGIFSDQTSHLMWRLLDGELADDRPPLAVLHIGVNNMYSGHQSAGATAEAVAAVVRLLCGMLLQATIMVIAPLMMPGHLGTGVLAEVAELLEAQVPAQCPGRAHAVNCISVFHHPDTGEQLQPEMVADGLHPTARGYEAMFGRCLIPAIRRAAPAVAARLGP
eukprot:TRINITY_DN65789_c0_g1_i1.p1 TRINITY_DN65789_c0_g1~~TRINITY_DN65789_c0_g1_i1.p1  ORF type:complete len:444 (+),score=71.36 TRINITY_DN65789_c0_g1_i1:197-1333(+)